MFNGLARITAPALRVGITRAALAPAPVLRMSARAFAGHAAEVRPHMLLCDTRIKLRCCFVLASSPYAKDCLCSDIIWR